MFEVLLKEKLAVENKLKTLQNEYLILKRGLNEQSQEREGIKKSQHIKDNIEKLNDILKDYKLCASVYENLSKQISESKSIVKEIDKQLNVVIESHNIIIPEHLLPKPAYFENIENITSHLENQSIEDQEEEDDSGSDKENSRNFTSDKSCESPFSPTVVLSRSLNFGDFTPAVKSHSKSSIFRKL
ncbi:unnamed protein product [Diamesa serratosioi]